MRPSLGSIQAGSHQRLLKWNYAWHSGCISQWLPVIALLLPTRTSGDKHFSTRVQWYWRENKTWSRKLHHDFLFYPLQLLTKQNNRQQNSKPSARNSLVCCHVGVIYTMESLKVGFTPLITLIADLVYRSFLCNKSGRDLTAQLIRVVHTSCQLRNLRSTQTKQAVGTAAGRKSTQ